MRKYILPLLATILLGCFTISYGLFTEEGGTSLATWTEEDAGQTTAGRQFLTPVIFSSSVYLPSTSNQISGAGSGSGLDADLLDGVHLSDINTSTASLQTQITALQVSTGTLQTDLATEVSDRGLADTAIGVTTAKLRTDITAVGVATGSLQSQLSNLTASSVAVTNIATADFSTVQSIYNAQQSAGYFGDVGLTDNGDGTVAVSSGSGFIRATDSHTGTIYSFTWSADASVSLTDNDLNYIYVRYNAGSPDVLATNDYSTIDFNTEFVVGLVYRQGTNLDMQEKGNHLSNAVTENCIRLYYRGIERMSGGVVSSASSRYLAVTAGIYYLGQCKTDTSAIDTSGSDTFTYYWHQGGVYVSSSGWTQLNNLLYDNGTSTAALTSNRYGVHWIYQCLEGDIYVVLGQGNYTLAQAEEALVPATIPDYLSSFSILIGKAIVQQNSANVTSIQSAFNTTFQLANIQNHNDLANIQGGTTDEYYHLTSSSYTTFQGWLTTIPQIQTDTGTLSTSKLDTTASFGGDVSGTYGALQVNSIRGIDIATSTFVTDQFWVNKGTYTTTSATGAGDAVLAATQTWTGTNTFNQNTYGVVPTGTILAYSTTTAPTGFLYCNGAAVSTTTYSALHAVIEFRYGNPGSGNMNIPDLRGLFVRGVDDGKGLDPESTRVIGSTQTDTMQGHYHNIYYNGTDYTGFANSAASGVDNNVPKGVSGTDWKITAPITDGTNGTPRTANETRPENMAVAYIIKY